MGFLSSLFGAIITVASAVISVAAVAVTEIIGAASEAWEDYKENNKRNRSLTPERIKEKSDDELKNINDEYLSIVEKYQRNGRITHAEKKRIEYLRDRRNELKGDISDSDEILTKKEISEESDTFEKLVINDNKAHLIQGQVGVSAFGKACPVCSRPLQIQWPRSVTNASVNDFFWGCTGWYMILQNKQRACNYITKMTDDDLSMFMRTDSTEAQVTNEDLTSLVLIEGPSKIIMERMDDVISDQSGHRRGSEDYRCPIHGEELVLRKKRQASGLLDQYFLGCSRWKPNNQGCNYIVKLKSVMQLSNLLKKESGSGIL